jgi:hypothetical protein
MKDARIGLTSQALCRAAPIHRLKEIRCETLRVHASLLNTSMRMASASADISKRRCQRPLALDCRVLRQRQRETGFTIDGRRDDD